jgi:hypothetical protein
VGYYGGGSGCFIQASAERQSIYISTLTNMRAITDAGVRYVVMLVIEDIGGGGDIGSDGA